MLDIVVVPSDLVQGLIRVDNGSDATIRSLRLASTDDLGWGANTLAEALEPQAEVEVPVSEGGFYWLAEGDSGAVYFGSTRVRGSENGIAYMSEDSLVQPGLCTMSLTNGTGAPLEYIAVHDWVGWASNDAVLDSRGPLPAGEVLDILIPTGTWSLIGLEQGSGVRHDLEDLVCADEAPFSVTLQ